MSKHIYDGILSRYLWVVRLPPQNSAKAKKLSGDKLPVKVRLVISDIIVVSPPALLVGALVEYKVHLIQWLLLECEFEWWHVCFLLRQGHS